MSNGWTPVATKGFFDLCVITRAKLAEYGTTLPKGGQFLGVLLPDGSDGLPVTFLTLEDLAEFVKDMEPRELAVDCAGSEDADVLLALIEGRAAMH